MNWYLQAMKQYSTFRFNGRAQRAEYWYFILFMTIGLIVFGIIDGVIGTFHAEAGIGLLSGIFMLIHIIPALSVSIRRLHDIGRSGWWYLVSFIPIVGPFMFIYFAATDSTEDNEYGLNPKKVS